jgi:hypothetical protein
VEKDYRCIDVNDREFNPHYFCPLLAACSLQTVDGLRISEISKKIVCVGFELS